MKKLIIIFCLSTIYTFVNGQDMSGEWNGVLKQEQGTTSESYYFQLNLIQKGEKITGTSKVSFIENPQFYGVMKLKGTFKNDVLYLEEISVTDENIYPGFDWCIKKAKLNFTFKKDGFCIEGTWSGNHSNRICSPGTIRMCKIVPIASL